MSLHAQFVQEAGTGTAADDLDELATASVPVR